MVASFFGVHNCVYDVCIAIIEVLGPSYLKLPSVEKALALTEPVGKKPEWYKFWSYRWDTHCYLTTN